MKRLFFGLTFIILASLVFSSLARQTQAAGFACNDPNAKWNKDYTSFADSPYSNIASWKNLNPLFSCKSSYSLSAYARIVDETKDTVGESALYCEGGEDFAKSCPRGQRCVREADCEAGLEGGVCVKEDESGGPKQSDVDCATGITKNYYSFTNSLSINKKTYASSRWRIIRFRCPNQNKTTCWVQVKETPPLITGTTAPAITVSDCCRQIVPDIGDPSKNDYSLNHLVQVAINIYECILCIVGSLILIMLITGAFFLLTSAGNDSMVSKGKEIISAAIIGGIIVFFSYLIINFTVRALGANFKTTEQNDQRMEIKPQGPSS